MRLQKYLAMCGVASRRACEEIIAQGRVKVNGVEVVEMGVQIDEYSDIVTLDGYVVHPEEKKRYIMLYKPAQVITALYDPQGRKTVLDLIPAIKERVFPVGRLDYDTEGLLILTNDGPLCNRLIHPSYEVDKCYMAKVVGQITNAKIDMLCYGVMLDDDPVRTAPAKVRVLTTNSLGGTLSVVLHEGRKRQVRRMLASVDLRVITLKRETFGPLNLGDLGPGKWRDLAPDEVVALQSI